MGEKDTILNDATELLERAQQAANRGDLVEMLEALAASRYLDGLTRRLQTRWSGSLPPPEVDECIAQAVDAACAAVSKGRGIRNLGAWLWKVAMNVADDKWESDYAHRADFDDAIRRVSVEADETFHERAAREELEEVRHKEAIRIARQLLPQIGEGQVVDVMELVIDAAENRLPDLPASSIAEALGIKVNAARSLISRGLQRFRRLAEQEGIEAPKDLPETDADHDEEEYNDA